MQKSKVGVNDGSGIRGEVMVTVPPPGAEPAELSLELSVWSEVSEERGPNGSG